MLVRVNVLSMLFHLRNRPVTRARSMPSGRLTNKLRRGFGNSAESWQATCKNKQSSLLNIRGDVWQELNGKFVARTASEQYRNDGSNTLTLISQCGYNDPTANDAIARLK